MRKIENGTLSKFPNCKKLAEGSKQDIRDYLYTNQGCLRPTETSCAV